MSFQVAYIPIGVGTFHLESAQNEFEKSIQLLKSLTEDGVYPDKMLLTLDDLNEFLDGIHPDLIVLQNITFANAAYACEVLKRFTCPVVLWTLREPVIDGGMPSYRLALKTARHLAPALILRRMPSGRSGTVNLNMFLVPRRRKKRRPGLAPLSVPPG